jgi:hypothetical protein
MDTDYQNGVHNGRSGVHNGEPLRLDSERRLREEDKEDKSVNVIKDSIKNPLENLNSNPTTLESDSSSFNPYIDSPESVKNDTGDLTNNRIPLWSEKELKKIRKTVPTFMPSAQV